MLFLCHRNKSSLLFNNQRWHQASAKKVQAILMLTPPQNVKQLCRFLGMVHYYRDLLARHSEILSASTNLSWEFGHNKATTTGKTKKRPWHWDSVHQTAFDNVNTAIATDVVLAYPDFLQKFEASTNSSKFKLGAVITQNNRQLAFFIRLNKAQQNRA